MEKKSLYEKGLALYEKYKEVIVYVFFGGLTTVVNYIVLAICVEFFSLSTILANTIAWVFAVIFAFITNKLVVFKSHSVKLEVLFKELLSFMIFRIASLLVDNAIMYAFVDILKYNTYVIKLFANIVVVILNYVASKLFIFKKKN